MTPKYDDFGTSALIWISPELHCKLSNVGLELMAEPSRHGHPAALAGDPGHPLVKVAEAQHEQLMRRRGGEASERDAWLGLNSGCSARSSWQRCVLELLTPATGSSPRSRFPLTPQRLTLSHLFGRWPQLAR
ncbi:MAG TPA: hypothetical protein VKI44_23415 [Acetobacteraceae bacterium]|nr:hypothetical protein [Acetobacteraceae bacterium]